MPNRLVYVVGPSGSGKDSLLDYVRERLSAEDRVVIIHRYITRPAGAGGENHIALSDAEFGQRLRAGLFSMHWSSHGLQYGIGIELHTWLARGLTVVVNGSRQHLPTLTERYPELYPVHIQVDAGVLASRLAGRGRESSEMIEARLRRTEQLSNRMFSGERIDNSGPLAAAGEHFLQLLRGLQQAAA